MNSYPQFLSVANEAVDLAANLLRSHQPELVTAKGDRDMVTEVDFAIERKVRRFLAERTPYVGCLGEEEGISGRMDDLWWSLDPIDGTANFVHGSPLCGVSLGLLRDGRPVVGVIDLPMLGTRYAAAEGLGAYANGQAIAVRQTTQLSEAIISIGDYATGEDAGSRNRLRLALTGRLAETVQRVRMHGSAALDLAWLAQGRTDAVITLSNKPWDVAAGVIISREAGAVLVDKDGSEHATASAATIGATPELVEPILKLVAEAETDIWSRPQFPRS
jgi:myo-inositol-1(or 4)-monophosphatase